MSEAWHIMHGRDVSGEEARRSQDIRARGGDGTLQIAQPSEDLTSIAADIESQIPQRVNVTRQWDPHHYWTVLCPRSLRNFPMVINCIRY